MFDGILPRPLVQIPSRAGDAQVHHERDHVLLAVSSPAVSSLAVSSLAVSQFVNDGPKVIVAGILGEAEHLQAKLSPSKNVVRVEGPGRLAELDGAAFDVIPQTDIVVPEVVITLLHIVNFEQLANILVIGGAHEVGDPFHEFGFGVREAVQCLVGEQGAD